MAACCALAFVSCRQPPPTAVLPPPKVTVDHPMVRETVDEEEFTGYLQASEVVEVRARVRGHIQEIHFRDGQLVKSGDLLIELDPRPFQVAIDQAVAQANAMEAQQVAAEKDVVRYRGLIESGAVSRQDLEKVEADALSFAAQTAAKLEEVKQHRLDLEFAQITAPIDGRISRAMLTKGNLVNAGGSDPLLTTIVKLDPIYAYFSVDERTVQRRIQARSSADRAAQPELRDQKVEFRFGLDSDVGFPHRGVLDFADNRIDSQTGTVQIRGVVDNRDGNFIPGSRVRVRVPINDPYQAVMVPDAALLSDQDKKYLLVVDDKNVVSRRDITPGKLLDDGMRVVLPANDNDRMISPEVRIIVLGMQRARVNYPVDPVRRAGL